jgi:hypothetical protein
MQGSIVDVLLVVGVVANDAILYFHLAKELSYCEAELG